MVKEIPLSKGMIALVDDKDYERVNKLKWHAQKGKYTWYAVHDFKSAKPRVVIAMHRYILGLNEDYVSDHANGNGLDNRRCNIRRGTFADNNRNKRKFKTKSSQYKGVCFYKRDQNWQAKICCEYKTIHIGYFNTEEEAARAYDQAAVKYFGEHALLNFPE